MSTNWRHAKQAGQQAPRPSRIGVNAEPQGQEARRQRAFHAWRTFCSTRRCWPSGCRRPCGRCARVNALLVEGALR